MFIEGGRKGYLKIGERKQDPKGVYDSNLSVTLIFFLNLTFKEAVCEVSLLIIS